MAAGLAPGSNTQGPVLIKEAELGGGAGAAGPQMSRDTVERMVLVYMALCTHMFDREHMLSAYNIVCISDSMWHMYTHTHTHTEQWGKNTSCV